MQATRTLNGILFRTEEGRYDLDASAQWIGQDLLVSIWGGERPHIGAVALAQPRPSLRDPGRTGATASVLCVVGHKEDEVVKKASEHLSSVFKTRVVVTAGIHWDNLDGEGIGLVLRNIDLLTEYIVQYLEEDLNVPDEERGKV
ncbi:MAG: hypothetical protein A4E70_01098 [Syntrophus sp. PtaU1.Bin005]|uniref:prenylated flavin chaperone LpdD n=1 Tax=Syntrophus sp. (in: bacteria) TaxID=48412 RepID=UPI0009D53DBA|nr:MAG: hypothetical protein A4E69_01477 [Syntrophus sp. PtaB.Bin138]OPY81664.1 MAG: hypothetical protein A4E70_01098 [Syntrophus sp. PtaU1.Bin005]